MISAEKVLGELLGASAKRVNDTHREKAPSKKTPAPRKSTNMVVWAVGTLNQLFIRGS